MFPNMKNIRLLVAVSVVTLVLSSCGVFSKNKQGCPSNGRNVGAEKVLDGSGPKKSPKFKA
jgi:hypothetical protein